MSYELQDLWNKTLGVIETEVSRANFLTLFKNTHLISLEDDIATIAAPSSMVIDLISKRYLPLIKNTLDKNLGRPVDVLFISKSIISSDKQTDDKVGPLFAPSASLKPSNIGHLSRVRPDYTFDTIAVSSSNQLAFTSATTIARNLGKTYNPLFIYGPVGVGKTHLMQAIANEVYRRDPSLKIIYLTSEEFTNEVVEAIRSNETGKMKKRFRSVNLLIIDDVQFIAGKDKVQEELFHTFNILIDNGSQIVLSSDRPPHEIKKLEQRLSSRFAGGLTVDIEPPDFELRTAILLIKAKKYGVELPIESAKLLSEKAQDIRSLEGVLLRVVTHAQSIDNIITLELVKKVFGEGYFEETPTHLHPDDVVRKVCEYFGIKTTQIKGPKREAFLVKARQIAMFILKHELGMTYVEIGHILGGRDHTTVMHGVEKVENLSLPGSKLNEDIMGITRNLRE